MDSESKGLSAPVWDGKAETCARYLDQIEALAEYYDCGDALDSVKMLSMCPTKAEYDALAPTTTDATELAKVKLYKANKRICAIITLGQKSDYGMSVVKKTKSADFPQGVAYRVFEILKKKNKPSDVTAEIELRSALEKVKFKYANDYYRDITGVCARFEVSLSEMELIKIMAKQVKDSSYVDKIVTHLKASTADDLEELCNTISENQRLVGIVGGSDGKSGDRREKEVQLASAGDFKGVCGFCNKKAGHRRKDCPERKKKQAETKCNHCGKKGHVEENCWKKHPDKTPQWAKDKAKETSGAEITVASVELDFGRVTL